MLSNFPKLSWRRKVRARLRRDYNKCLSIERFLSVPPTFRIFLRPPRTLCNALRLSVCLSVYLFVCLLAILHKNYGMELHENFTTDVSVRMEELIKFSDSDPGFFEGFFNIAR